jgi:hypothetical protein
VTHSFTGKSSRRDALCLLSQVTSDLADANAWGNQEKAFLGSGEMRIRTPALEFME